MQAGERMTIVVDNNKIHFFDPSTNLRTEEAKVTWRTYQRAIRQ